MAGSPERQTNQPLTREAKDRIGDFYLRQLLGAELRTYRIGDFETVSTALEKRFLMPPSLVEELGLDKLHWQRILGANNFTYNQLPVMIRGVEGEYFPSEDPDINKAIATIEIARRVNLNHGQEEKIPFFYESQELPKIESLPQLTTSLKVTVLRN